MEKIQGEKCVLGCTGLMVTTTKITLIGNIFYLMAHYKIYEKPSYLLKSHQTRLCQNLEYGWSVCETLGL